MQSAKCKVQSWLRKGVLILLVCGMLLCSSCTTKNEESERTKYNASFLTLFDTVTTITGFAESEEAFTQTAQAIHDDLLYYHQLFDIYNDYEGIHNLKTVNDNAGIAPVKVDSIIIDLLMDCRDYCKATGGKVNVAMGSVLHLWHVARNDGLNDPANACLPEEAQLKEAAEHADFDDVILDPEACTVYLADPDMRLDVGAIAKGWATQRVAEAAPTGLLISVGGNVCATGPKAADTPWVIGIQNPEGQGNLHTVYLKEGAVVTSGDYQRSYTVDGIAYHHIIDPDTQMPGRLWRSVTVVCPDSALADALSTALFLLPLEEGKALLQRCQAQAFWVDAQGNESMTPGFEEIIRT